MPVRFARVHTPKLHFNGGGKGGRGGRGGGGEKGVNASYTRLKSPQAGRAPRAAWSAPSTENGAGYPPSPPELSGEGGANRHPSNTPPGSADCSVMSLCPTTMTSGNTLASGGDPQPKNETRAQKSDRLGEKKIQSRRRDGSCLEYAVEFPISAGLWSSLGGEPGACCFAGVRQVDNFLFLELTLACKTCSPLVSTTSLSRRKRHRWSGPRR